MFCMEILPKYFFVHFSKQLLVYTSGFGEAEYLVLIFNILLLLKAKRKFSKVVHLTKTKSKTDVKPENKGEPTNVICLKYTF